MASSATVVDARVPFPGDSLESKMFDTTFDGVAAVAQGSGAKMKNKSLEVAAASINGRFLGESVVAAGPVLRLPPGRSPPPLPELEGALGRPPPRDAIPTADVKVGHPVVPRSPDDTPFDKLHWAVYAELGKHGITITRLSGLLANLRGTTKLDDAFTGDGVRAVSIGNGHDLQDWAVDAALVPYHVAGCLGITYYIMRKPSAMTFHAFYKRYRELVGEMVLLCEGDTDGAYAREFADVILHHAGTASAYVNFFLSTHRVVKFGAGDANRFNEMWMNKLFHAMSSKISEVRRIRALYELFATHGF